MFKVYLEPGSHPHGDDIVYVCEVGTLVEADKVLQILESRWAKWTLEPGYPEPRPEDRRVAELEGTTVFAVQDDGAEWIEDGPGEWRQTSPEVE